MKANAAYYDLTQKVDKIYQNYHYSFIPDSTIPSGYQISDEALNYVIEQGAKALNSYNTQSHGILVDWAFNTVANGIFSLYRNGFIICSQIYAQLIDADQSVYSWNVSLLEIDPNYQYSNTYGPAYSFEFEGFCHEHMTLILDQNGDIYGTNPIGNYTYSQEVGIVTEEYIPEQYDPNEIWIPSVTQTSFYDLKPPYISGKSLYFYIYESGVEHEYYVPDFTRCIVFFYLSDFVLQFYISNVDNQFTPEVYKDGAAIGSIQNYPYKYTGLHKTNTSFSYLNTQRWFALNKNTASFNFPSFIGDFNTYGLPSPNSLGYYNGQRVNGYGDVWLDSVSTNPTSTPANPNPAPIGVPIPVTQIPSDPEDPIPQNPTPDPVPGEPVNPLPPIIRPLPSIVSGNDDLWPSVVELENIEVDLGGYISGLDDYEFPDLSSITSSFSGAIVWVSTIMSTLFNGSDFSILFAVLSSFFIVAALLGLYKWWNHK